MGRGPSVLHESLQNVYHIDPVWCRPLKLDSVLIGSLTCTAIYRVGWRSLELVTMAHGTLFVSKLHELAVYRYWWEYMHTLWRYIYICLWSIYSLMGIYIPWWEYIAIAILKGIYVYTGGDTFWWEYNALTLGVYIYTLALGKGGHIHTWWIKTITHTWWISLFTPVRSSLHRVRVKMADQSVSVNISALSSARCS